MPPLGVSRTSILVAEGRAAGGGIDDRVLSLVRLHAPGRVWCCSRSATGRRPSWRSDCGPRRTWRPLVRCWGSVSSRSARCTSASCSSSSAGLAAATVGDLWDRPWLIASDRRSSSPSWSRCGRSPRRTTWASARRSRTRARTDKPHHVGGDPRATRLAPAGDPARCGNHRTASARLVDGDQARRMMRRLLTDQEPMPDA